MKKGLNELCVEEFDSLETEKKFNAIILLEYNRNTLLTMSFFVLAFILLTLAQRVHHFGRPA
jgi:hypothetical protein